MPQDLAGEKPWWPWVLLSKGTTKIFLGSGSICLAAPAFFANGMPKPSMLPHSMSFFRWLDKMICTHMYSHMRTTLILEESVFHKAKSQAVQAGTTLSALTNSALRHFLMHQSVTEKARFVMPVFGGGRKHHQTPADFARLRDEGR